MSCVNGQPACGLARASPRPIARLKDTAGLVRDGFGIVAIWFARAGQRRLLAELPDRTLQDIGLTRGEAMREARKPFWRGSEAAMPNEMTLLGPLPCQVAARSARPRRHAGARRLQLFFRRAWRGMRRRLGLWQRRCADARELEKMSDRELRDFGVSRYDLDIAARKSGWRG